MKVRIISSTKPNQVTPKNEFDKFSGHCAGICYMAHDFDTILNEDESKTERRVLQTAQGGHHSVFDHNYVTLYLEGIPKFLAMLLNNEKMYTTSEKSARYTKMSNISDLEKEMYDKWLERFKTYIGEKYPELPEKKREKLAMENARYLLSVLTPTCMAYTVSYRQLNYLYLWLLKQVKLDFNEFITEMTSNNYYINNKICNDEQNEKWRQAILDLIEGIEYTKYLNPNILDFKNRGFSLIQPQEKICCSKNTFTDVYSTVYMGSFAQLAQAQRHRTINYDCTIMPKQQFYVPPILEGRQILLWLQDCEMLYTHGYIPQCTQILIRERGTYEDFLLKCKERICSAAQLEIAQQTQKTLEEYIEAIAGQQKENSINQYIYNDLSQYATYKARCSYPDYECPTPCGWLAGINLERQI